MSRTAIIKIGFCRQDLDLDQGNLFQTIVVKIRIAFFITLLVYHKNEIAIAFVCPLSKHNIIEV